MMFRPWIKIEARIVAELSIEWLEEVSTGMGAPLRNTSAESSAAREMVPS
jgi:hypothetical protein